MKLIITFILFLLITVTGCTTGNGDSGNDDNDEKSNYPEPLVSPADLVIPGALTPQVNTNSKEWYKDAVFYHIWVKSFADSDSDGIGDLKGIINKLDTLNDGNSATNTDLGINAIWLSPIFKCSYTNDNMHGYDTTDYFDINPLFGTKDDVTELLKQAHQRGIRVIFDFVPNHTSSDHPWFIKSRSKTDNYKDVYVWSKTSPTGWNIFGTNPWYYSGSGTPGYYLGIFWSGMPDLNFELPWVQKTIKSVAQYWLDAGFDGVRIDAVRYLYENGASGYQDQSETHDYFKSFRKDLIDSYDSSGSSKMMVGEAWTDFDIIKKYYGSTADSEFQMCFDFPFAYNVISSIGQSNASFITNQYNSQYSSSATYPSWARPATFLNNHDNVSERPVTQYSGSKNKALLAEAINILSPGTPFIYYGNDIGMTASGESGDVRHRRAYNWTNHDTLSANSESILSWYRYLIRARLAHSSLRTGSYKTLTTNNPRVIAYTKKNGSDETIVLFNLTPGAVSVNLTLTNSGVTKANIYPVIGASGKTDAAINDGNYSSFSVNGIPAYGMRVYYVGSSDPSNIKGDVGSL